MHNAAASSNEPSTPFIVVGGVILLATAVSVILIVTFIYGIWGKGKKKLARGPAQAIGFFAELAGDQERGGFLVRLTALGLAGYIALYFTEKHPRLWYAYGATGLVVTTVAVRTGLSVGRTVKDLEAA